MSLTVALNTARSGLTLAERRIAVVSGNINNADRAGYTRKEFQANYTTTDLVTVPEGGQVVQSISDPLLAKQINRQSTISTSQSTLASYLSDYVKFYGGTGSGDTTLSSSFNDLSGALKVLEANPGELAANSKVVTVAQSIAAQLNSLSANVQDERLRANNDIGQSVQTINQSLQSIQDLNRKIVLTNAAGENTADLQDQRNLAVAQLSQEIGIQYFVNPQDELLIYTNSGTQLLGSTSLQKLTYNPVGTVNYSTVYPGGFPPVTIGGVDVTTSLTEGRIGALIQLRDTTLAGEQAKLDNLANTLRSTVNAQLNAGSASPPLNQLVGSNTVNAGTAVAGSGTFRLAVTDATGVVQSYQDFNLASYPSVGALIGAINAALPGASGVTATIDANNHLSITANTATNGVSTNSLGSTIGGQDAAQFFGLNDLFINNTVGGGATTIQISPALLANSNGLAVATLSSGALVPGTTRAIGSGDVTNLTKLVDALDSAQSFTAAGNFGAQNISLSNYADAIISSAAVQSESAKSAASTSTNIYTYLNTTLQNKTGVNINEETANLTVLQTAYQANAQLISTVKNLFDTLIQAVR